MNTKIYSFTTTILFSITLLFILQSCSNPKADTVSTQTNIPELLNRSEKIQLGIEWDQVQNIYVNKIQAIQNDSNDHEARLTLAQLFVKEARVTGEHGHYYPAALKMVNAIIDAAPEQQDLLFMAMTTKAGIQLSLHEFAEALETGEKAIQLNPRNAQIYGVLVDANVEMGNYEEAVIMADRMIAIKPDIRSYSRISYLREIHGDVQGALEAMELAVRAGYPGLEETAWAMLTLGDLYSQYDDSEKARQIYEAILETRADYPFAVAAIGDIDYQQKDFENAEKHLKTAIDIIPEVGFYIQLAHLYSDQNRTEELKPLVRDILLMLQDDVEHGHNMNLEFAALYLDLLDTPEKALEYAQAEYTKRPDNIDVNRLLARIYQKQNDLEKMQIHSMAAAATNSKHPELMALKNT